MYTHIQADRQIAQQASSTTLTVASAPMEKPAAPSPTPPTSSRSQVRIAVGAVVCSECEIAGEVVIGANTIVHPKARIIAEAGPIHIGAFNLIEEQVEIINRVPDTVMQIGDHNVFEVGAAATRAHLVWATMHS